ncbi:MAG: hypothetical protein D6805_07805 [Planctomycetota bacterium]|nr:MAG: hypothetical protein D6805_07805 [Planctomycetota bacterium]
MLEKLEKLVLLLASLGFLTMLGSQFVVGKKSYFSEKDVQIFQRMSQKEKEEIAWEAFEKFLSPQEREKLRKQREHYLRLQKQRKKMARLHATQKNSPKPSQAPWGNYIQEDPSTVGIYPNTRVWQISEEFKLKYASSFQEVMTLAKQAGSRFIQTPQGIRPIITWIKKNTIIHRLGFRQGDVILKVNGMPVSSVSQGRAIYNALKNEKLFMVEVYRQGQIYRFVYKIQ